jgi:hypothetical protein
MEHNEIVGLPSRFSFFWNPFPEQRKNGEGAKVLQTSERAQNRFEFHSVAF